MKVLGISGSLRKGSYNTMAMRLALRFAADAGAEVSELELQPLDLPFYNQDVEDSGLPESVKKLSDSIRAADVLLIASPEYNHSISGVLKNAIDWASRGGNAFSGKVAAIFGASTGFYGTVRAQPDLRKILAALDVLVVPQPQVMIQRAQEAFDGRGRLVSDKTSDQLKKLVEAALKLAKSENKNQ